MEKKQCPNCGAPLKMIGFGRYKCEYCGSEFHSNKDQVCYIQVSSPGCHTIMAKAEIDDYWVKHEPDMASKEVTRQLSASLADTLKEYMRIDEMMDPMSQRRIYRGMIRVVPLDYRY